ncbi:MAG: hypothetical protein QOC81_4735 [Thermoanaerobaculia bacterium]|jgi:hypothetical protein|nr:hypothetical protein [Thermoanaerobaculia bacterium]
MNSMLATDADEAAATHSSLETWAKNEPMRHVPSAEWMSWKVDQDLRRRIEILFNSFEGLAFDDPRRLTIENELRALCRAIDRLSEAARHARNNHPPHDLGDRIAWSLNQTVASINSLDPHLIGRRFPFHTGERSRAESIYGALLVVIQHIGRVLTLIRTIDRNVDEHLLDGLVKLETPLRAQPIA